MKKVVCVHCGEEIITYSSNRIKYCLKQACQQAKNETKALRNREAQQRYYDKHSVQEIAPEPKFRKPYTFTVKTYEQIRREAEKREKENLAKYGTIYSIKRIGDE